MKKSTVIRIIIAVCMIALGVGLGIALDGIFTGEASQMWQRLVYIFVVIGTAVSGFLGLFSPRGFLWGYGWIGVMMLFSIPGMLPEPWNRYATVVLLAAMFAVPALLNWRNKRAAQKNADEAEEEELTEEEQAVFDICTSQIIAVNSLNGRMYQLFCREKELLAYRVGGELKGVNEELIQLGEEDLRPVGKDDIVIPLSSIRSVRMKEFYGGMYRDQAVVKTIDKTYRFNHLPLTDGENFLAFWRDIAPGKVTVSESRSKDAEQPEENEAAPDEKRLAVLKAVKTCFAVYLGAVNLAWLFLDVPYVLFSCLSVIAFPVLMALYFCFPNEFTIAEGRKAEGRISLIGLVFISGAVPMLRTILDFNFRSAGRLILVSAIFAVVLLMLFLALSKEWKKQKAIIALVAFTLLYYAPGAVGQLNSTLDFAQPAMEQGVISDMHISQNSKSPDSYYVTVQLPDGTQVELKTSSSQYERAQIGDAAVVITYPGAFGVEYSYLAL